ncbi:MAG: sulfatase [Candidatus Yanofskybacteria bacterium]|nr:sulfatase [Candidatus Yanofskybacteria bacterium]
MKININDQAKKVVSLAVVVFLLLIITIGTNSWTETDSNILAQIPPPEPSPVPKPNILLILTDDQRADTMAYMPLTNQYLGSQGVAFTNNFASTPICCPSRSSILTGMYTHNHKVIWNFPPAGGAAKFTKIDGSTMATWLHDAGYATGLFGKYLNKYDNLTMPIWPYTPPGWDEWQVFKDPLGYYNYTVVENGTEVVYGTGEANYSTNVMAQKVNNFIQSVPTDKPFFAMFTPYAPHLPATPLESDAIAGLTPYRPPSYNEADVSDKPVWVQGLKLMTSSQQSSTDKFRRKQLESLQPIDRAVKSFIDTLTAKGQLDNTIIIYTSDNGMAWGEHRYFQKKNCVYEECIRTPLIIKAPGISPRVEDNMSLNIDLPATIAEYANVSVPSFVDGVSLKTLLADPSVAWRQEVLLEVLRADKPSQRFYAVRDSQYVYAEYFNGDKELYDLIADPYQLENKASDPNYQTIVSGLKLKLDALKQQ